mmetsp:Transcript_29977/g.81878  ORF Transcript_29977/g.81878 Transcript_29977/m.81878 type:complete len:374 (-) Transcript_29977:151-1272(-)
MLVALCSALGLLATPLARVGERGAGRLGGLAMSSQLQQLSEMTVLSIDTGDLSVIEEYAASGVLSDATTNPLFVSQAGLSGDPRYVAFVDRAVAYAKANAIASDTAAILELASDRLAVELGLEIVKIVPGYVSTEVDIRASFDTAESLRRARRIIAMYEAEGVDRSRVLVKLAGTWEGIQAARELEKEGITCNITLIFGFIQAVAAAQAGARLISPFPGRIKDWHSANGGKENYEPEEDPGVICVKRIYRYYKKYGHEKTICMPASWRPSRGKADISYAIDEIVALAGVDRMTIPPPLLSILAATEEPLTRVLSPAEAAAACEDEEIGGGNMSEATFRMALNADVAATTKMAEGINAFVTETLKLEEALRSKL